jgi:predicted esterase
VNTVNSIPDSPFNSTEHHLRVTRTARYWTLGGEAANEVWFVCHGYAQLARRFIRRFASIATPERRIVAPEALSRFYLDGVGMHGPESPVGATWMTREDRLSEIEDYIAYLDALYDHTTSDVDAHSVHVVALGFSQGLATVARWAARSERSIDDVVLWSGGFPPELTVAPRLFGSARLTIVSGAADPTARTAAIDAFTEMLESGGLHHAHVRHAGGHEVTVDALAALLERVQNGRHV